MNIKVYYQLLGIMYWYLAFLLCNKTNECILQYVVCMPHYYQNLSDYIMNLAANELIDDEIIFETKKKLEFIYF